MHEMLGLLLAFSFGVVICAVVACRVATRFGLPWQATLTYFGVVADGEGSTRRRRAARVG